MLLMLALALVHVACTGLLAQQQAPVGVVMGTVVDADGSLVSGAQLTLTVGSFTTHDITLQDGSFRFINVPGGNFKIVVKAVSFAPVTTSGSLAAGEHETLDPITLLAAMASDSVDVTATSHDIALTELHAEEKQRVLGFIPNYYISYDRDARPLDQSLKAQLAFRTSIDPVNFALIAAQAGIEQATNTLAFGQDVTGFFQRFGVACADFGIGNTLGGYVFPVIFRQDPRYFVKGTGSFKSRLGYALSRAVISRGDNLKWQPAYAGFAGELSSGALSNLYYPAANRNGVDLTFINALVGLGTGAIDNVIEEFVLRHFSTGVPKQKPTPTP